MQESSICRFSLPFHEIRYGDSTVVYQPQASHNALFLSDGNGAPGLLSSFRKIKSTYKI